MNATILLALALLLAGCGPRDVDGDGWITVACLGDSNTQGGILYGVEQGWCEQLGRSLPSPPWRTLNRGRNGARACHSPKLTDKTGEPIEAEEILARVLAQDHPDVVILAYGSNDALLDCPTEETIAAFRRLLAATGAAGAQALVALVPPVIQVTPNPVADTLNARIDAINRGLREMVPARDLIDFARGMEAADYAADGLHVGPPGQAKRAAAARGTLLRWRLGRPAR
jgi:lysophospholipase L1-like esterase